MSLSFIEKLEARIAITNSLLCVGLDPHESEVFGTSTTTTTTNTTTSNNHNHNLTIQEKCDAIYTFCKNLIDATIEYTCCYKPNIAFFEAIGGDGIHVLIRICNELIIPHNIPILLDVKRGDIGTTAIAYAQSCYSIIPADAITISPLMGYDSIVPFISEQYMYHKKGIFILCKTSNPGSNDLLNLQLANSSVSTSESTTSSSETLYERIASLTSNEWYPKHTSNTFGLVVGATDIDALKNVRRIINDTIWILAPGIGAQGGNIQDTCIYGMNQMGNGLLIPISRGISTAKDPKLAAKEYCTIIQTIRNQRIQEYNNQNNNNNCKNKNEMKLDSTTTTSTTTFVISAKNDDTTDTQLQHSSQSETTTTSTTGTILQSYQKEFILFSIQQNVLQFGTYQLKSGRISPYFFNAGLFHTGYALYMLGTSYATCIMSSSKLSDGKDTVKFDVIFGPAYKGIPLGAIVSSALYQEYGINVDFTYNRKEVKDHGEGGQLVGASMKDKRVLIIDDVITAGTAIRESYDLLMSVQAKPIGVVIALDRAEIRSVDDRISAVQAVERDFSIPVVSIVTLVELQQFLEQSNEYDADTLKSVIGYRKEYGAM